LKGEAANNNLNKSQIFDCNPAAGYGNELTEIKNKTERVGNYLTTEKLH